MDAWGAGLPLRGRAEERIRIERVGGDAFQADIGTELHLAGIVEEQQGRHIIGESVSCGIEYSQAVALRVGRLGILEQAGEVIANFLGPQLLAFAFDDCLFA